MLSRWLEPPNPPRPPSQEVVGALGENSYSLNNRRHSSKQHVLRREPSPSACGGRRFTGDAQVTKSVQENTIHPRLKEERHDSSKNTNVSLFLKKNSKIMTKAYQRSLLFEQQLNKKQKKQRPAPWHHVDLSTPILHRTSWGSAHL